MALPEIIKDIDARVKKSGDTMTGKLYTTSNLNGSLACANTNGAFRIDGGTSYEDGAFLSLHGANSTYYPNGAFQLVASDGTARKELFGDTTGILKWDNNIILHSGNFSSYALPLTGGTITGTLKMSTYYGIYARHIDGSLDGFSGELYLNYNNNAPIMLGHGGGNYISADGAYYSGTTNKSKSLLAFTTSIEPNNNPKYKLILTKKITAWTNYRATFATSSRHTGNGILSIAFGCDNGTVSDSTVYGQITYFGNNEVGAVWNNSRFILYYNNTNQEFYLFCYYYDYGPTTLTLLNSYTSGSGGQIVYDNLVDGVYVDSFDGYGVQVCQSKRGWLEGDLITGAVWNDYAEYRKAESIEPGRVVVESADGEMKLSTERLQPGAEIISDTFGFAIGETDEYKTPIAATGRVLAYPNEDRYSYPLGCAVCSGPNGTVSQMTREEIREYPERIIGTVSEIPEYKTWGTGNVEVDGRIWIRIK